MGGYYFYIELECPQYFSFIDADMFLYFFHLLLVERLDVVGHTRDYVVETVAQALQSAIHIFEFRGQQQARGED